MQPALTLSYTANPVILRLIGTYIHVQQNIHNVHERWNIVDRTTEYFVANHWDKTSLKLKKRRIQCSRNKLHQILWYSIQILWSNTPDLEFDALEIDFQRILELLSNSFPCSATWV